MHPCGQVPGKHFEHSSEPGVQSCMDLCPGWANMRSATQACPAGTSKCWCYCGNPMRSKGFGDTANPCRPPERGLPSVKISARAYERRTATDGRWGIVEALPSTQGASSVPVTLPCSLHFPTCCGQETGFAPRQDFCLTRNRVISCSGLQPWELRHQRSHTLASLRVFRKASC